MPEEKKFDPFKPPEPSIPGVSRAKVSTPPETSQEPAAFPGQETTVIPHLLWVALAALVALVVAATLFYSSRSTSAKETPAAAADAQPASAPDLPKQTETWPLGPGPVATAQEMASTWSAKRFVFRNPGTGQDEPAIVVRLPRGQYWGFSLREPFGNCELEYVTDLKKLRADYHFSADHPMVGDPCNHTVYDLLRYGTGPSNDGLVRGEIVQGPGIRPPLAIEIRTQGNNVLAVREE